MADIALAWNAAEGVADWTFADGDLASTDDLATAIVLSLFTDAAAAADFRPTDGSDDRRGWWGDSFEPAALGSRLWTLERAVKTGEKPLLLRARDLCQEALQWMVSDGVAESITVKTSWLTATTLGIEITVQEPRQRAARSFKYAWAWTQRGM